MKKQKIFNFALTTMCVAVLSACGSSGGGSLAVENTPTTPSANANANTGADNSAALAAAQQEAAAAKAAAEKAAAEKAAAEQAAKDAAEKAKEDTAKAVEQALKDKEAADKAAAEAKAAEEAAKKAEEDAAKAAAAASDKTNPFGAKDKLTAEPDTARPTSFVGFKQTVKVDSNLATNKSEKKDSTSDIPTPMAVQNPHPSLDTIVVAEPSDNAAAARVYLEDFDTRFVDNADVTTTVGNRTLKNIYKTGNGATNGKAGNPAIETQRAALEKTVADAKAALSKIQQEANDIKTKDLAKVDELLGALDKTTYTNAGATEEQATALYYKEMEALYAKKTALQAKLVSTNQKADEQKAKLSQLQFALNTFNNNNPVPTQAEKDKAAATSTARLEATGKGYATKTETVGTNEGNIWILSHTDSFNQHQNFTEKSSSTNPQNIVEKGFVYKGRDHNGNILVEGFNVKDSNSTRNTNVDGDPSMEVKDKKDPTVAARNLDGTVAEVYGYRSKAVSVSGFGADAAFKYPQDVMDYRSVTNDDFVSANNLPLVNDYFGAKLHNVQYGRVTTKLDSLAATEDYLKAGLKDGDTPTFVASFGEYGKTGTENHYFYRGINNVGAEELKVLKADPKNGVITYNGHAVAYGLNNNYRGDISIPTAIGAQAGFVSGNHATLRVDLGNNQVTGSIYNKWYDSVNSPDKLRSVPLVSLKGVIADNGNIAGTATREDNKATGVFGATLFGSGAEEVGGTFASDKHSKDEQWGGVFGGIRGEPDAEAPTVPNMAVGVDKKN